MSPLPTFAVIIPAAGTGNRFGAGDKLLVDLAGRSVLQRSLTLFAARPEVTRVVIVTGAQRIEAYRQHLLPALQEQLVNKLEFVVGGQQRWESVRNGLRHLTRHQTAPAEFVGIHDAARPLCPAAVIDEAFRGAVECGGAVPCVPEPATLKRRGTDANVAATVDRAGLFQAQTPQCFQLANLLAGYEALHQQARVADLTDDAQVYERMGRPVRITAGAAQNMKITTVADVALARALLAVEAG